MITSITYLGLRFEINFPLSFLYQAIDLGIQIKTGWTTLLQNLIQSNTLLNIFFFIAHLVHQHLEDTG